MMMRVKAIRSWIVACLVLCSAAAMPQSAFAKGEEDAETDARLEGYTTDVKVSSESTALIWFGFLFMTIIALAPIFKDAKRTHLD